MYSSDRALSGHFKGWLVTRRRSLCVPGLWLSIVLAAIGCGTPVEDTVVLRSTVDQDVAAPILAAFHRSEEKLIHPLATFGAPQTNATEFLQSFKADQIEGADVVWTDNVLLMIELQRKGVLQPHEWKIEPSFPTDMRAKDQTWCGFAAVARVLLINTDQLSDAANYPTSVDALIDPKWKGRCAIARPVGDKPASVTSTIHAALIAHAKGMKVAEDWFKQVAENAVIMPSNTAVATAVAKGQVDWGITDSSDAIIEVDSGSPVAIIFPDQSTQELGTVRIPHTVAILKSATHPQAAVRLANYLVLPTTEDRLAMSDAAQIPLSRTATFRPRVLADRPVRWASIDFEAAEKTWQSIVPVLTNIFANTN
jgi:iron(III) transport system substrate-binding protein